MLQIPRDGDLKCFSMYFMCVFVAPALVALVANLDIIIWTQSEVVITFNNSTVDVGIIE